MTDHDLQVLTRGIAPVIKDAIAARIDGLLSRIEALEQRPLIPGPKGEKGDRGDIGLDGTDGRDGVGFEDMDLDVTDAGVFAVYSRGDVSKRWRLPIPVWRDIYRDGERYERGDLVTWAGAMWIAKEANEAKPGLQTPESRAWKLCVKAGRDGKPGPEGKAGPAGPRGEKGEKVERW